MFGHFKQGGRCLTEMYLERVERDTNCDQFMNVFFRDFPDTGWEISMLKIYLEHEGNDRNLIDRGQTYKTCESNRFCFRMDNPPVLKHGSRSLIWMRMWNDWNHTHATKVKKYIHDSSLGRMQWNCFFKQ